MRALRNLLIAVIAFLVPGTGFVWAHGPDQLPHRMAKLGTLKLESGSVLKNVRMSYVTHGRLNQKKDNAILLLHGFGANHHLFDHLIGPGNAFDTDKYFVIVPDTLGNTQVDFEHSTSPTNSGLKMNFPTYNVRDMIKAEHNLVTETLGVSRLLAVSGISMGAMKSVQFAVSYPDFMVGSIPISGSGLWDSQFSHYQSHLQSIVESCQGWNEGNYDKISPKCGANGLRTFIPYFYSREWWDQNITSAESYNQWWNAWWNYYLGLQDARDLYYQSKALVDGSISDTPGFDGDLNAALKSTKAKTLFLASPYDQFFTPKLTESVNKAIPQSRLVSVDSNAGHLICCGADPQATWIMSQAIKGFLDELRPTSTASR